MTLDPSIDIQFLQHLDALSVAQLDDLPYGAVRVDANGIVLACNHAASATTSREPAALIGRDFFSEIAPCTQTPDFYGRFRRGVLSGTLRADFEFVFAFAMQPIQARIVLRSAPTPGAFWILIEPLNQLPPRDVNAVYDLIASKFSTEGEFDFSHCDQEPIATCGLIQPFGCLLVLDPQTLHIQACSANSAIYLGQTPAALLGQPVSQALPTASDMLATEPGAIDAPRHFQVDAPSGDLVLDVRVHRWRERLLLEIEPGGESLPMDARLRRFDHHAFQQRLLASEEVATVCHTAATALRDLTGFERVVVYRLEASGDGVVVAESALPEAWPSILGLRYPATDIPAQARALYCETPMRYAPSRDHPDIPLLSHGVEPTAIDIGIAHLRAQSPLHRSYLERFAVDGSMSLSIMDEDRLWGLVIFHHRRAHPVTPNMRQRLLEISGFLSVRLALIEERDRNRATEMGLAVVNHILGEVDIMQPFPETFRGKADLLREMIGADVVQIYHYGQPLFDEADFGLEEDAIHDLLTFLETRPGALWSTDCLARDHPPAAAYPERIAGVLAIFVDDRHQDILLFGRRRVEHSVNWAGEPGALPFSGKDNERPFGLPNRSFQVWQEARTHHAWPWSAFSLATGHALKNLTQQVIVANAAHFERLVLSLGHQRDQLHQSREAMRHSTLHDALTGLPNRARFREALIDAIEVSLRDGLSFAVALVDIDHFKLINDTLGHDQGDKLLCATAERLIDLLPQALIARLGGDEFVLLLPPNPAESFIDTAERVVKQLQQVMHLGDESFSMTGSLGLTIGNGESDPGEVLKQADLALYRAKEAGRNCARPFDPSLKQEAMKQMEIARVVLGRQASDAIEIVLQPQIAICAEDQRRRFEVLSRWRTESGDLIMPGDFIPAAERNGLIREVTTAVIEKAIALLRSQLEEGTPFVLGINISAADLEARWFSQRLLDDLNAAGVPPEWIEVEITESLLLRMTPRVKQSLNALAHGGVKLSLDDFGTGFSSMAYLRELPISSIKIDREFIWGLHNLSDYNLVAGMIALAHSIGKEVIAEGIETAEQLACLHTLGCDWGQGYFWSRPVPPAEALAWQMLVSD